MLCKPILRERNQFLVSRKKIYRNMVSMKALRSLGGMLRNICRSCEWHHSSPRYNPTSFYYVEDCCNQFKGESIERLKVKYKSQSKPKPSKEIDNKPYYAKVEYSISTYERRRIDLKAYAIVRRTMAYIKDDYNKKIIKKNIEGKHFSIVERYESRPNEMSEDEANTIMKAMKIDKID